MLSIATAGHVDHGKSTLVRRLTGTDPDRWYEERRRGLTIDLGFAELPLRSGGTVALVDVPGHARFVKNMLAGVGSVAGCIFVVAADEGWMAQSTEHLRILEIVGADRGIVVLTKAARVDADLLDLARMEVHDRMAGTGLAGAPVIAVDALTGVGIEELEVAIDGLAGELPPPADEGRARLWVDRSFAVDGAGCVVTGTLGRGSLAVGDSMSIITATRLVSTRIRGLQSFGRAVTDAAPGGRVAVSLVGVSHRSIHRGDAVVVPDRWHLARRVDASLTVLADYDRPVTRRSALAVHIGTDQLGVRLQLLLGSKGIGPGSTGCVRLSLPRSLPLVPGDRYVLRDLGLGRTVGGGEILDVDPQLPVSRARPDRSVDRIIRERGRLDASELERLTGEARPPTIGMLVTDPAWEAETRRELEALVEEAGPDGLDLARLDDERRVVLTAVPGVIVRHGRARPSTSANEDDEIASIMAALEADLFSPPRPVDIGLGPVRLRELVQEGRVVEHDGVVFSAAAVTRAGAFIANLLSDRPAGVSVSEVRAALDTSRRRTLALLAILDANGSTRRAGDLRVAGPRLPPPLA